LTSVHLNYGYQNENSKPEIIANCLVYCQR
jgi:hypothetical protein